MTYINAREKLVAPLPHPQVIPQDNRLPGVHQQLLIACDQSGSMFDIIQFARNAILETAKACLPNDQIAVVGYNHRATLIRHFAPVTDLSGLEHSIQKLIPDGGTQVSFALQLAMELFLGRRGSLSPFEVLRQFISPKPNPTRPGFKSRVIVLSDGWNFERDNPLKFSDALKHRGVQIDSVGIGKKRTDVDEELLSKIASIHPETKRPRYRFFTDPQEMITHFKHLATSITK